MCLKVLHVQSALNKTLRLILWFMFKAADFFKTLMLTQQTAWHHIYERYKIFSNKFSIQLLSPHELVGL